jgi:hypothetical protein
MSTLMLCASLAAIAVAQSHTGPLPADTLDGALAAIASAQSQAAARDLHVAFTPGVWLTRLGGESKLGPLPGADELVLEDDFDLDGLEVTPNFELAITKGTRWQVDVSGFDFSTDSGGEFPVSGTFGDILFAAGDEFDATFDMTSIAVEVSYWKWHPIDSKRRPDTGGEEVMGGAGRTDLRFALGAGLRWLDVEQTLEVPVSGLPRQEGEGEWFVPMLVLQMDLHHDLPDAFPVLDTLEILAAAGIGPAIGGDGGVVVTLRAGMRGWVNHNFSADFGYRLLETSVENDDYELEGGLQGLFLSGTLYF